MERHRATLTKSIRNVYFRVNLRSCIEMPFGKLSITSYLYVSFLRSGDEATSDYISRIPVKRILSVMDLLLSVFPSTTLEPKDIIA